MRTPFPLGDSVYRQNPTWLKPVLVAMGVMFITVSLFIMVVILKREPQAVAQTQMSLAAVSPAAQAQAAVPPSGKGSRDKLADLPAPKAMAPGPQVAPLSRVTELDEPVGKHASKASKKRGHAIAQRAHAKRKSHRTLASASKSTKRSGGAVDATGGNDPILNLLR